MRVRLFFILVLVAMLTACAAPPAQETAAGAAAASQNASSTFSLFETYLRESRLYYRLFYNAATQEYMVLASSQEGHSFLIGVFKDRLSGLTLPLAYDKYRSAETAAKTLAGLGFKELAQHQWPMHLQRGLLLAENVAQFAAALSSAELMPFIILIDTDMFCFYGSLPGVCAEDRTT